MRFVLRFLQGRLVRKRKKSVLRTHDPRQSIPKDIPVLCQPCLRFYCHCEERSDVAISGSVHSVGRGFTPASQKAPLVGADFPGSGENVRKADKRGAGSAELAPSGD